MSSTYTLANLIFIWFLLCYLRSLCCSVFCLSSFSLPLPFCRRFLPCGLGTVLAHPHERTTTGGTGPASHPPPEVIQVSAGKDGAVRRPWIPQNPPRAGLAGALIRWAGSSEADARSLPPTAPTRPASSVSLGGSAP